MTEAASHLDQPIASSPVTAPAAGRCISMPPRFVVERQMVEIDDNRFQ
jgi:hypothetical protein